MTALALAAAAVAAAAGACGGGTSESDRAGDAVQRYLDARGDRDAARVCDVLDRRALARIERAAERTGEAGCPAAIAKGWKDEPPLALTDVEIPAVAINGRKAKVMVEATAHRIRRSTAYTAVREGEAWHVAEAGRSFTLDGRPVLRVPSDAMLPTLRHGDELVADPKAYSSKAPAIGDVVAFHPPVGNTGAQACASRPDAFVDHRLCVRPASAHTGETFLKRVVAGPGDRIAFRAGHVILNGRRAAEPYVRLPCDAATGMCDLPHAITVPAGHYYLVGDNRDASADSRFFGAIPRAWITGRVR
jgi:signal peptidase I